MNMDINIFLIQILSHIIIFLKFSATVEMPPDNPEASNLKSHWSASNVHWPLASGPVLTERMGGGY